MKIGLHTYDNYSQPEEYEVSTDTVRVFVEWLLNTRQWRHTPELLVDRADRLRKALLQDKQRVAVERQVPVGS
jgi:thiamine phosphate synthase YjbQ (UPF0047 family)